MKQTSLDLPLGRLAAEFGMSRDILRRVLAESAVGPVGQRGGHPVYRLADAHRAVIAQSSPGELNPHSRLALARAIQTEDAIRARRRELLERADAEAEMAGIIKAAVQFAESLPDVMERDCNLTPAQVARMESLIDALREELYQRLTADTEAEKK